MKKNELIIDDTKLDALKSLGPIAVLMGGNASEREISLESGQAVFDSLLSMGFDAVKIDTESQAITSLQTIKPVLAFIALHGRGGEDGTMQAVLESLSIPYTGSAVLGSALAMDKVRAKNVWRGLSLPTPKYLSLTEDSDFVEVLEDLSGTAFVKPAEEGSSIGMSLASSVEELKQAYLSATSFGINIFAEKLVVGPEYTVAILEGYILPSIQITTAREFYNFEAKYSDDDTGFLVPSGLNEKDESQLQSIARKAFDSLGCRHWGRVDFMQDNLTGEFYLLEVNTVPGLTSHSLVPMAAKAAGIDFNHLMKIIIDLSYEANR
tara:strand:+ start:444 stop:1409 length:966 start_codon:yes stop_codon:yes gene_type:complete